jgi:hypothetical protein
VIFVETQAQQDVPIQDQDTKTYLKIVSLDVMLFNVVEGYRSFGEYICAFLYRLFVQDVSNPDYTASND